MQTRPIPSSGEAVSTPARALARAASVLGSEISGPAGFLRPLLAASLPLSAPLIVLQACGPSGWELCCSSFDTILAGVVMAPAFF